ncbi:unnamed protein product [Owenia fusiformis]|uniref:C2H2-type domain-containing protein n=1 Tax=Owenia fusiformis TaxID=6347 RepID=A0A8S4N6X4_OWEFU|nr:unnamed protein product [Owenia fusiformis]
MFLISAVYTSGYIKVESGEYQNSTNTNIRFNKEPYESIYERHESAKQRKTKWSCDICGKKFISITHLNNHKNVHTGEKPFKCPLCLKGFTQTSSLNLHQRRVHQLNVDIVKRGNNCRKQD